LKKRSNLISESDFCEALRDGRLTVCVIGLGRIGLPTAAAFADAGAKVIGCDNDEMVVRTVNWGKSHIPDESGLGELMGKVVSNSSLTATTNIPSAIAVSDCIIICVPTPVMYGQIPDYSNIMEVSGHVAKNIRKGRLVIIESTVGPGTVENQIIPLIEKESGLKAGIDFGVVSCPERADPGKILDCLRTVPRVVGGINAESARLATLLYTTAFKVKVVNVRDPKTANAAKLTENIFRDVNIALVNEFAMLFEKLAIDTFEVVRACSSKWNFVPHYPGAGVGGPCLPTNSYYLVNEALRVGRIPYLIRMAREINDRMPEYVVLLVSEALNDVEKTVQGSRIAILGASYKPDLRDVQMAPSKQIVEGLARMGARITMYDPMLKSEKVFGVKTAVNLVKAAEQADGIVICTAHKEFYNMDLSLLARVVRMPAALVDARNVVEPDKARRLGFSFRAVGKV